MHITFAPKGILQIDDASIVYRNFSGEASKFNREGDRNFALKIVDPDLADELLRDGWNVKDKTRRDEDGNVLEGEEPFFILQVKIKFNDRGPVVYLKTGNRMNRLDEESVSCLDDVDIVSVDMDIRPYDWDVNGKQGRTAYLQSICVIQKVDRFMDRYGDND